MSSVHEGWWAGRSVDPGRAEVAADAGGVGTGDGIRARIRTGTGRRTRTGAGIRAGIGPWAWSGASSSGSGRPTRTPARRTPTRGRAVRGLQAGALRSDPGGPGGEGRSLLSFVSVGFWKLPPRGLALRPLSLPLSVGFEKVSMLSKGEKKKVFSKQIKKEVTRVQPMAQPDPALQTQGRGSDVKEKQSSAES